MEKMESNQKSIFKYSFIKIAKTTAFDIYYKKKANPVDFAIFFTFCIHNSQKKVPNS